MYYKEFLRVRNLFAWFAIVMVAIALLIWVLGGHSSFTVDTAAAASAPSQAQQAVAAPPPHDSINAPGVEISDAGSGQASILLALAGFVASIFATVLGVCLACENAGHLEIAWTRPASRLGYAARIMAVDVAGIFTMFAFTVGLGVVNVYVYHLQNHLYFEPAFGYQLVRFLIYPLAWFALVAALTASLRSKGGAMAGFTWLGASLLVVAMGADVPPAVHAAIKYLNYLNPVQYGSYSNGADAARHAVEMTPIATLIGLCSITVLFIAAALAQWRRLEA